MRELQAVILDALAPETEIDPAEQVTARVAFLRDYLQASGAQGLVLGISGGQDSTLAGRLCQLAVERRRADGGRAAFVAVRLPYGEQSDEDDARAALEFIRPDEVATVNIAPSVDACAASLRESGTEITDFGKGNIKARIRMTVQYGIAGRRRMLVVGTDHAAESVTGFYTKYGDGAADVAPLAGLNKRQGRSLLELLGSPHHLCEKVPTADLLDVTPGQSDESALGVSYDAIDDYLEGREVAEADAETIELLFEQSEHKRRAAVEPSDMWWR